MVSSAGVVATTSSTSRLGRRVQRGFSLIELGIVIAVIAVLAAVVIFGRGYIQAGRVTKAVDGMETIRKSASVFAGLQGGTLANNNNNQIPTLMARQLLPGNIVANQWFVSGSAQAPADAIIINDIRFGQAPGGGNAVAIQVVTAQPAVAQDVWTAVASDNNLITTAGAVLGGLNCAGGAPATQTVVICFRL